MKVQIGKVRVIKRRLKIQLDSHMYTLFCLFFFLLKKDSTRQSYLYPFIPLIFSAEKVLVKPIALV